MEPEEKLSEEDFTEIEKEIAYNEVQGDGFVVIKTLEGIVYAVNMDHIVRVKRKDSGSSITMIDGETLEIADAFETVVG